MRGYPLGVQTFSEIIERNLLYIDKTQEIYNLLSKSKIIILRFQRVIFGFNQIEKMDAWRVMLDFFNEEKIKK